MTYDKYGLYIDLEHLEAFGENIARTSKPISECHSRREQKNIVRALRLIKDTHNTLQERFSGESGAPGYAQWLLDNWYLAQREGLSALSGFKTREAAYLRASEDGDPLLAELAAALVKSGHGAVSAQRIELFLTGAERACVLSHAELSLFIPALKAACIYEMAILCEKLISSEPPEYSETLLENLFSSLRLLSSADFSEVIERSDKTEQLLRGDPTGEYSQMDEKTRAWYRRRVSFLAKRFSIPEYRVAEKALYMSESDPDGPCHVGRYLFSKPLGKTEKERSGSLYMAFTVIFSLFLTVLTGFLTGNAVVAVLVFLPVWDLIKSVLDFVLLRIVQPRHIPRMDLSKGIPDGGKTICVISALLTDEKSGKHFSRLLEEYHLANRDSSMNLLMGILADLPEAGEPETPEDGEIISSAAHEIEQLNEKYKGGFFLLCRRRTFDGKKYTGWERKRGAVTELARLICGSESGLLCAAGDPSLLKSTKYILTLDGDTRLCPGAAKELIGAMLHPLNTPVTGKAGCVISGHALIQPRMAVELESASRTDFARVTAGQGGVDPYGCDSGEIYMDLFGRGGFSGKGIIDAGVFLRCMEGRIPDGRILSHDTIEGAFLRGGYMGDVELTDSCPASVLSYYKRLHRWTRGDWQNIPWLFSRGRELPDIERWRIFDNLRRSLVPAMTLGLFLSAFLFPARGFFWGALIALLAMASHLVLSVAGAMLRQDPGGRVQYHSAVIHGVSGGLIQTAARLILLPYEAWICVSAAVTALWRMGVSGKNLLQWQTSAQSEKNGGGMISFIRAMWLPIIAGFACVFLSPEIFGKAVGILWLLSPPFAYTISLERGGSESIKDADRAYLLKRANEIWRYFSDFCTPEENFLPPDNWQENPAAGLAHRTSPTNIGLCLLSAMAAVDLRLENSEKALPLIESLLDTMEKLPKWNGHFYNWYNTVSMGVLPPGYVSTVDSGNLAACLITLRSAMAECGRADLSERISALLDAMDFSILYDRNRRLFYIGIDCSTGAPTNGWYDLLASEARLAGFVAIARGDIDRRHWRRLSRVQVQKDGYCGMASWTGTMFEYLMPELVMPCYKNSLLYESAKFCIYVQRRRVPRGTPWGISESAFYSLDPSLNYRYKAHGCASLALKRGMDDELVVSPYSTYLALPLEPRGAMRNLKNLENFCETGKYGFWEAIDFTPGRCMGGSMTVRCVMSHHLGMSLVSICNYLCSGVMQRRFMSDPAMSAHAGLLQEKIPLGGVVLHRRELSPPEKPSLSPVKLWHKSENGIDFERPFSCVLTNGAYSVILTESGLVRSSLGALSPYSSPSELFGDRRRHGLYFQYKGSLFPLLPEPGAEGISYRWEFSVSRAVFHAAHKDFESTCEFSVSASAPAELRSVSLSPLNTEGLEGRIIMAFEPVLAYKSDYINHPAFYRLGLETHTRDGCLIVRRIPRGRLRECFLCAACDRPAEFSTAQNRTSGDFFPDSGGWQNNCLVRLCVPVRADVGSRAAVSFAIAVGRTEDEAYRASQRALIDSEKSNLPAAIAMLLNMDESDITAALSNAYALSYPLHLRRFDEASGSGKREELWQHGISGDLPVIAVKFDSLDFLPEAKRILLRHAFLTSCSIESDLVFITDDGGEYHRSKTTALGDLVRSCGRENMLGAKGGIHIISENGLAVIKSAAISIPADGEQNHTQRTTGRRYFISDAAASVGSKPPDFFWGGDGSFSFSVNHSLPPRVWSNMLSNGNIGYVAADCGCGSMWYSNARECRISPWTNDPFATSGEERLDMLLAGKRHTLFASSEDGICRVTFAPGWTSWEKSLGDSSVKTTAFIPPDVDARIFIIETKNAVNAQIEWLLPLVLGVNESDAALVKTSLSDAALQAENPRCPFDGLVFSACTSSGEMAFTCHRPDWLSGDMTSLTGEGLDPCFGLRIPVPTSNITVIACGSASPDELKRLCRPAAALDCLRRTADYWRSKVTRLKIFTGNEALDNMMNGWLVYQSIACRVLGRTSIYQSGGAMGFRDQLQDAVNLIMIDPSIAEKQIISCCEHQYEEGDVQHWWHHFDSGDRGVRTRCSDDLLWLPWALCEYVEKTGESSLCSEKVRYITSPPLGENESDRYETPQPGTKSESVLSHARAALDAVLSRGHGQSGLLFFGSGDWNDGMDGVGKTGESVWLTWFFSHTAHRFASLMESLGLDGARYEDAARQYGKAANGAWDGFWYLRGRFGDGAPLGSKDSRCCRIDSIAQSFAALCPEAEPERVRTALNNACKLLFDRESKVIKLFDPPFEDSGMNPGYIESYGPGLRENGGQYTHGAIWLAMACLRTGMTAEGTELIDAMLPQNHDPTVYEAEPFVIAADVSSSPNLIGKAGWSWYTGSAGWLFRVVCEDLLGIKLKDGRLFIEPRLDNFKADYTASSGAQLKISVKDGSVTVNGRRYDPSGIALGHESTLLP